MRSVKLEETSCGKQTVFHLIPDFDFVHLLDEIEHGCVCLVDFTPDLY